MKKNIIKKVIIFFTFVLFPSVFATRGDSVYLNLGINGSYDLSHSNYYDRIMVSWGGEAGIPLSEFFELSFGYNYREDRYNYNDDYTKMLQDKGYSVPDNHFFQINKTTDMYSNIGIGFYLLNLAPSIFYGILSRKMCSKDSYDDYGCMGPILSWNAGVSLSLLLSKKFRIKTTWRISPSSISSRKDYDNSYSLGITMAI